MKTLILTVVLMFTGLTCIAQETGTSAESNNGFASFGAKIDAGGTVDSAQMTERYRALAVGDSLQAKFNAEVVSVCQMKGCWMQLKLNDGREAMVRFKDYGFFVPKDIVGHRAVVEGVAFVDLTSVEDQRHYAKDKGLSDEEVAKINAPAKTYSFIADGVLIGQ